MRESDVVCISVLVPNQCLGRPAHTKSCYTCHTVMQLTTRMCRGYFCGRTGNVVEFHSEWKVINLELCIFCPCLLVVTVIRLQAVFTVGPA